MVAATECTGRTGKNLHLRHYVENWVAVAMFAWFQGSLQRCLVGSPVGSTWLKAKFLTAPVDLAVDTENMCQRGEVEVATKEMGETSDWPFFFAFDSC